MRLLALSLTLSVIGCFSPEYPENLPCGAEGWCPPGQACNAANLCISSGGDSVDGGPVTDASSPPDSGLGALTGIDIGPDVSISVGQTHQFTITGIYENGTAPITDFAIWDSTNNNVMFVDFMGVAHGEAAGMATASARYDGRVDTAVVTVSP